MGQLEALHSNLVKNNWGVPADFNQFKTLIQDSSVRAKLFNNLKAQDWGVPSNLSEFDKVIGIGQPVKPNLPEPALDYSHGLLGAAKQVQEQFAMESRRPTGYIYNPVHGELLAQGVNPFSISTNDPLYQKADSLALSKHKDLSKVSDQALDEMIIKDRDAANSYFAKSQQSAKDEYVSPFETKYAPDKFDPSDPTKFSGTVGLSGQGPTFVTKTPEQIEQQRQDQFKKLGIQKEQVLSGMSNYYSEEATKRYSILNPKVANDPALKTPEGSEKHAYMLGVRSTYPLQPEKVKEFENAYNTTLGQLSEKGVRVTGVDLSKKIVSDPQIGEMVAKGNAIEKALTTAKVKGIDEGLKDYQKLKTDFDTEFARADKILSENPQAKADAAFMKAYNENKKKYELLVGEMTNLETDKQQTLGVQEVQDLMVKRVAAPYQKLQETTERYQKENEAISNLSVWNPMWFPLRMYFSGKTLLQRGAQGAYDLGSLMDMTYSYLSGAKEEDLKKFAFASKSYEDQMRVQLGMPSKQEYEKETRLAYTDPETDELKYNWASLPYFMINTYLESAAMGKAGLLLGGRGSSLLSKVGQFAGMSLAAEALFGQQMLMSEMEKGTDFGTAYRIHLFRTALEGLTEMFNPLEIKLAGATEKQLIDLTTDEAETLLFRANHVKEYLAKNLGTRKWDNAVEWLYRTGSFAKRGAWDATDNAFKEYLEEFMSNVGNWGVDKYVASYNPNYKQENEMSLKNEWLTMVNTVAGMPLMLGQGAYLKHKQAITSAEYQVSTNPEVFLARLEQDYKAGRVNDRDYTIQKAKINQIKQVGAISAEDYKRIDDTLLSDSVKDNTKLLLYSHNKELYEKSLELEKRIKQGETGKSIDKLSEEVLLYQDQKEALIRDAEKFAPFSLSSPIKSKLEQRRIEKANMLADNLYSAYHIAKLSNPQELIALQQLAGELKKAEQSQESPNKSVLAKYDKGVNTIQQRLEFLNTQEVNPTVTTPNAPASPAVSAPNQQDMVEVIARKFIDGQKGNTQELTPEEEDFLTKNEESVSNKVNELAEAELPVITTEIQPGPATLNIGGQPVTGKISKVYSDESFDFEFETEDGRTAYYPRMTKADLYQETPSQTLFGKYRVVQSGPTFEIVDINNGEIVGTEETFEEAADSARALQIEDEKTIEDFKEEQKMLAQKKQQALTLQEALKDTDAALTLENEKVSALPKIGVVDSIEYAGKRLVEAFMSIANRMRDYTTKRTADYYYKDAISDELDPKYSFIQSFNKYQPGTPVKLVIEENESYLADSKADFENLVDSLQKTSYLNPEDAKDNDYHSPIRIEDMEGNLLGYIHALAYIQESNVAPTITDNESNEDNLLKNYNALKQLRKGILNYHRENPGKEMVTTILAKSAGHLSTAMKDEEGENNYLPLQERFKNPEVLTSLQIATAENIAKEGQIVQNNIASGRPIVILPMPNGKYMAAGMRRSKLTEEVSKSIIYAIQLYRARARRSQEIEDIANKSNYNLSTIEGLHGYISSLVYVGSNRRAFVDPITRTDTNMVNVPFIDFDRGDKTIWFSLARVFKANDPANPFEQQEKETTRDERLNTNGIYRISLEAAFDPTLAYKQLEKVIQSMHINVDKAKLEAPEYESESVNIPILELKGQTIGIKANPEFTNTGSDYKEFISNHLSTNILEHEVTLPNGSKEFVYFEQSTIMIDPNVFLPKEQKEKPEVVPTDEEKEVEIKKEEIDLRNSEELGNLADETDFEDLGFGLPKVATYKNPSVTQEDIDKVKEICNTK